MKQLIYPCVIQADGDGYMISFRDIPEALSAGESYQEALDMAVDCLSTALMFYLEDKQPIPTPSKCERDEVMIAPSLQMALKVAVIDAFNQSSMRQVDLARSLDMQYKSVTRILDPNHNTQIAMLDKALSVLGKRILVTTDDKAA